MPKNLPAESELGPLPEGRIRVTPKELAARMEVEYLAVSGLLKVLVSKDMASHVATRPNPRGKGRGSKIYEMPESVTLEF